ncbi:Thioesterase [Pseudomonas sp. IT-P12]|jgi:acyl-coenzyme A thioesterase PaaI-like protein|uniref:PaaI family thioesterase n=1 Tax=Pseudomonas TaxID=286 RepID=UPI0019131891|nr:PaaI family thioesterase [Pseudomonas fluorescens]
MIENLPEHLQQAHEKGEYAALLQLIPYAQLIGVECSRVGDDLLFRLPANRDNIGNPLLPAIHGGVIAGFMELSAALHLLILTGSPDVPKIIDFSLDYLRAGQFRDTWARCQVCRQGRRVANVAVTAWQSTEAEPIATARAHFKVDEPLKSSS